MAHDDPTTQARSQAHSPARLTPEARRAILRDFADRMLLKITAMDDPADLPGVERAVRTAAAIERIYSRCDRAEAHAPDPKKLEAERADNTRAAIKARVHLADTLEWGEKRRKALGQWWDAADTSAQAPAAMATPVPVPVPVPARVQAQAPAAATATSDTDAAEFTDESPEMVARVMAMTIDTVVRRCAEWTGFWPDGAAFAAGHADWRQHTLTAPVDLPAGIDLASATRAVMPAILEGCNACTLCAAETRGAWPGGIPYRPDDDPDFWSMSAALDDPGADTAGESPGPACLPPWIVHRRPPDG